VLFHCTCSSHVLCMFYDQTSGLVCRVCLIYILMSRNFRLRSLAERHRKYLDIIAYHRRPLTQLLCPQAKLKFITDVLQIQKLSLHDVHDNFHVVLKLDDNHKPIVFCQLSDLSQAEKFDLSETHAHNERLIIRAPFCHWTAAFHRTLTLTWSNPVR
jgi:hypothetical protein